ncbi:coatomer subunit beta [Coccidioides immitis RMSCC 3703]|uniref:Beta'-coat protein n=1 Tax=Coccidioides immitis RMSCC 3703 TaxID=454286 RepID=A0A0J8R7U9_COCIT|nr:coatomer subunit beta [Coccidioides immitis RMSCC 3703]
MRFDVKTTLRPIESGQGNRLPSYRAMGHVYIWSYETQSIVKTFELTDVPVRAGRFIARKNWIVCGSDDFQLRVYNYNTSEKIISFEAHPDYIRSIAALIATLEGHTSNVSFACYHPELPIIISGSEEETIKIWNANTYGLEQSLSYGWKRAWCVSYQRGKQGIAMGFDDGAVVVKMGREEPAVSMDGSGKIVWARHNEVVSTVIKGGDATLKDGAPLTLPVKELGSCEVYPQSLMHSPNGRFVSVCGDGEYIIYTALAWRNKAFGQALDFAWGSKDNSNDYAIRESQTSVKIFRNFKEKSGGLDVGFQAEGLCSGVLLGVKGQGGIGMFDWESGGLVRRIEVDPKAVYWSESGELVTLACDDTFYVLRFSRENYIAAVNAGEVDEDGVEAAFEIVTDINDTVRTGEWVGDCFIYTNSTNRLNYLVGDQTYTISHFDQPMYLLGYLPRDGRIYLADKDLTAVSFSLSLAVVEYQTLVLRGDMESASELLPDIPQDQMNKIARFLEGQGYKDLALDVATDQEHRFELSLSLGKLDIALEIAREADVEHRWKTVGDAAMNSWDLSLAEECFTHAKDLGSLLLLHSSSCNTDGLRNLAERAKESGAHNVVFSALWQLGDMDGCIDLLVQTNRITEAVLLSQTYKPSRTPDLVLRWKESLEKNGKGKVARTLGVPPGVDGADEELFPEWDEYLKLECGAGDLIDVNGDDNDTGDAGGDGEAEKPAYEDAEEA